MVALTRVREIDLHKVAMGTPAEVRVDAYPELELAGSTLVDLLGGLGAHLRLR
jgi:multidrug resistance efflux pump